MVSRFAMQAVDPEQVKLIAQMRSTDPALTEEAIHNANLRDAELRRQQRIRFENIVRPRKTDFKMQEDQHNFVDDQAEAERYDEFDPSIPEDLPGRNRRPYSRFGPTVKPDVPLFPEDYRLYDPDDMIRSI